MTLSKSIWRPCWLQRNAWRSESDGGLSESIVRARCVIRLLHKFSGGVLALCLTQAGTVHAEDVVRRYRVNDGLADRQDSNLMLIAEAMRRTEKECAPGRLENHVDYLVRERERAELLTGERLNLGVLATQSAWEEKLTPIRIPVDMGVAGYRVSLIRRQNRSLIAAPGPSASRCEWKKGWRPWCVMAACCAWSSALTAS